MRKRSNQRFVELFPNNNISIRRDDVLPRISLAPLICEDQVYADDEKDGCGVQLKHRLLIGFPLIVQGLGEILGSFYCRIYICCIRNAHGSTIRFEEKMHSESCSLINSRLK